MTEVCVDASFALKVVLFEPERERVRAQWANWIEGGTAVIAPWLFPFEIHSVLRGKVTRGEVAELEAVQAWRTLRRHAVRTVHPRGLFDRAWAIARELGEAATYDAIYLAVADLRDCELWTADERFASAASRRYPKIRPLG